jgi:sporulation integral membrane protein YlbJ
MKKNNSKFLILIIPIIVIIFNVLILLFPTYILKASKDGLLLWFNTVLPSLLPFVIGTNLLVNLGAVTFVGTLLEPIMKPLFGVSGAGGFALITGMTSGYPMGAKTVSELRQKNHITQVEAQRLISFTNNSGPLFIIGAIGIGMFSSAKIGYFILLVHYTSAIITGLIFKYYKYKPMQIQYDNTNIFNKALENMHLSRQSDPKTFGTILGDSVNNAMHTMLTIGGFIVLFSVIVKMLEVTNFLYLLTLFFSNSYYSLDIDKNIITGFFVGIVEITNGSKILSLASHSKLQLLLVCAIVSFGGFSIYAQTICFTNKTDINSLVYIASKLLHSFISILIGFLLYPLFNFDLIVPVSLNVMPINKLMISSLLFIFSLLIIAIIILIFNFICFLNKKIDKINLSILEFNFIYSFVPRISCLFL